MAALQDFDDRVDTAFEALRGQLWKTHVWQGVRTEAI